MANKTAALKENAGCEHTVNLVSMLVKYVLPRAVTLAFLYQNMYCNFQRLLHVHRT